MEGLRLFMSDHTLQIVSMGSILLGMISGVLGSFAVLRKQSLLGDAISHAALPGITAAFIFTQTKNTEILLLGALLAGLLATGVIMLIDRYSRIKFDSALGLVLSVFFGAGLVMLTYIQKEVLNANQAGLDKFIFGQASTLLKRDVKLMIGVGLVLLILVVLFWKEFKILSFDADFAQSLGYSVRIITLLLSGMIVAAIIVGLQTVGVILMSAMLVAPAVAARQWTDRLSIMVCLAALFGAVSGVTGTVFSSLIEKMPTGPSIVVVVSLIVVVSILFAPNRGLLWRKMRERKNRKDISEDKIVMRLYALSTHHKDLQYGHHVSVINPEKNIGKNQVTGEFLDALKRIEMKGWAKEQNPEIWVITPKGMEYAKTHPMAKEDVVANQTENKHSVLKGGA